MSWQQVKLRSILVANYGKALKKENRDEGGKYEVFGSAGFVGNHRESLTTHETIIIGRKGSVGKVIHAPNGGWVIDTAFYLTLKEKVKLDWRYLFYALKNSKLDSKTITTSIPGLNRNDFYDTEIPLPPLDEQKRIAAILDKADAIRRKRQQAIDLADDFLRSVFLDMFGDPVTNPKGWEVKKLVELCGVGSSKRVFVDDFVDIGIPFYRGTEVGKLGEGKSIEPSLFISPQHYSELRELGGVPDVGDLLLPSICPDGRIWRVKNELPFYFKDGRVLWIKSGDSDINSDYLRSLLQRIFFANYSQIASGTTFAELKIIALKNLNILVPPIEKQIEFSNVMRKTMANIETLNLAKQFAEDNFNSLSQKAFAGEL